MKTKKQLVYEFIVEYSNEFKNIEDECPKIETTFLSEKMNMQRSNVSSVLNQLVKEGKIIKSQGRPVLYSLANDQEVLKDDQEFSKMIGYNQSLKETIKIVKVALTYPTKVPMILLVGEKGVGVETLSKHTYLYACSKGILKKNAPYTVIDSSLYNEEQLSNEFFSESNVFDKTNNGLLLIRNASNISKLRFTEIMKKMDSGKYHLILMVHVKDLNGDSFLRNYINFITHLPTLKERNLLERYELIVGFVKEEASKINKRIGINYGLMQSLLLFPTKNNIDGLRKNIQFGIANAFTRAKKNATINLELSDFYDEVRKGLLYVKEATSEIKDVIGNNSDFVFDKDTTYRSSSNEKLDIYHRLDKKKQMLNKSINSLEADNFVFGNIEIELNDYLKTLIKDIDESKLKSIVSPKLYNSVKEFIYQAGKKFNQVYPNEIFFGMCMHLNNIIVTTNHKQRISNNKIMEIIEKYDEEYFFSKKFIKLIESEFNVKFSSDETVFITLFLTLPLSKTIQNEVVTLVAMHGESSASSIVEVVKKLMPVKNIYSFDLSFEMNVEIAYEKLKQKLIEINQGKGIIVIYDMGSIQIMIDSIREETNLDIRYLEIPISLLALSSCKYSEEGHDIDEVYNHLMDEYNDNLYSGVMRKNNIIIALSSIKENMSHQIKEKLLTYKDSKNYVIYDFNIDEKALLVNKINEINNHGKIAGIIGTYNPNLFNLKFVDYYYLKETNTLQDLFEELEDNFDIFEYFDQQFNELSKSDLEITLIPFVSKIENILQVKLKEDERIGLLIHMTSLIDRLTKKQGPVVYFNVAEIIEKYPGQVEKIKQALLPIESYFNISIGDGDAATIARIILKC